MLVAWTVAELGLVRRIRGEREQRGKKPAVWTAWLWVLFVAVSVGGEASALWGTRELQPQPWTAVCVIIALAVCLSGFLLLSAAALVGATGLKGKHHAEDTADPPSG